jgi:hypothetical protein
MSINYVGSLKQVPVSGNIGLKMDMTSIFGFISLVSPFFIMFMMFTLSIFNSNFKGFVYLIGVSIMYIFINILNKTLDNDVVETTLNKYHYNFCQLFGEEKYSSVPSFNSALYIFTLTYLAVPMIRNNIFNLPLVIFFVLLFSLDTITRITHINCTSGMGVALGAFIGLVWGIIYYNLLYQSEDTKKFLFYDDYFGSNKIACARPSEQKFKCDVYENGELIKTI